MSAMLRPVTEAKLLGDFSQAMEFPAKQHEPRFALVEAPSRFSSSQRRPVRGNGTAWTS